MKMKPSPMKQLFLFFITMHTALPALPQNYEELRHRMVNIQIEARGISHRATLEAMKRVKRHLFVPIEYQEYAYEDMPLPIGYGQTISQPFMVASMTALLEPNAGDKVLEIGTGSGYQAAVLAGIVKEVYTIEIIKELGMQAERTLRGLGYENVEVIIGDGYQGLEAKAPFDAIIVTAAPEEIPPPLVRQLREGGKMVIPVGEASSVQTLFLLEKKNGKVTRTRQMQVRFVPFTRENDTLQHPPRPEKQ